MKDRNPIYIYSDVDGVPAENMHTLTKTETYTESKMGVGERIDEQANIDSETRTKTKAFILVEEKNSESCTNEKKEGKK